MYDQTKITKKDFPKERSIWEIPRVLSPHSLVCIIYFGELFWGYEKVVHGTWEEMPLFTHPFSLFALEATKDSYFGGKKGVCLRENPKKKYDDKKISVYRLWLNFMRKRKFTRPLINLLCPLFIKVRTRCFLLFANFFFFLSHTAAKSYQSPFGEIAR